MLVRARGVTVRVMRFVGRSGRAAWGCGGNGRGPVAEQYLKYRMANGIENIDSMRRFLFWILLSAAADRVR